MSLSLQAICDRLDRFSTATGHAAAWLTLAMVVVTLIVVVLRYVFDSGFIWLQESVTWMHAVVFMTGAAYTMREEQHVRVDVFYRDMSPRWQCVVNALGVLIFVFPFCLYLIWESWEYVGRAWAIHEISRDAGGLPYPAIPLLKSVLLLMPVAVALQGLSLLLRSLLRLKRG